MNQNNTIGGRRAIQNPYGFGPEKAEPETAGKGLYLQVRHLPDAPARVFHMALEKRHFYPCRAEHPRWRVGLVCRSSGPFFP